MGEQVNVHRLVRLLGSWEDGVGNRVDQLASGLLDLIKTGLLPAGTRLPSERQLASVAGMARATVGHAYTVLRDDGALSSRSGVGTFVSSAGSTAKSRGDARLHSFMERPPSDRIDLRSAAVYALPMVPEELGNLSSADFLPLMNTHGYLPEGLPELRSAIANYYALDGLPTAPEDILVTAGAQQAVHIVAKSFLDAGDTVIIEEPTYRGGIESLRATGAKLVSVPSGDGGIDLDELEAAIRRHKPKMVLILSTVHNPTGSSLGNVKRAAIGAMAVKYGVTLIDDASTSDALIRRERPNPLAVYAPDTITVGSASKLYWGGLRIGWIRAEARLLKTLIAAKGAVDLGSSIPSQVATARLLLRIEEARDGRRAEMIEARASVLNDMAELLPDWEPHPVEGGASLWVRLPDGVSATALAEFARRAGVDVLAGPTFSASNGCDDHLRIAFSASRPVVREGLRRLAEVWSPSMV